MFALFRVLGVSSSPRECLEVAELKKLNETRRKIAPQLVEQRQESFRRWGAWQTEVFDLNAARLRTLQNMQTQVVQAVGEGLPGEGEIGRREKTPTPKTRVSI